MKEINSGTESNTLSPEEHDRLINRHTELISSLEYLKQQRDASDETAHTEELMNGDQVNEKFIDRGWTDQIIEAENEIAKIEAEISDYIASLKKPDDQPGLEL